MGGDIGYVQVMRVEAVGCLWCIILIISYGTIAYDKTIDGQVQWLFVALVL